MQAMLLCVEVEVEEEEKRIPTGRKGRINNGERDGPWQRETTFS